MVDGPHELLANELHEECSCGPHSVHPYDAHEEHFSGALGKWGLIRVVPQWLGWCARSPGFFRLIGSPLVLLRVL